MLKVVEWAFNTIAAIIGKLLIMGVCVGITVVGVYVYMYFTDESSWIETPRIEDGRLYLHVAHEEGRIFKPGLFSNVTLATQERVSRRTREYINVHSVPSSEITYLGKNGMKIDGITLPPTVMAIEDTIFACIFIDGDSVGCRKIAR